MSCVLVNLFRVLLGASSRSTLDTEGMLGSLSSTLETVSADATLDAEDVLESRLLVRATAKAAI